MGEVAYTTAVAVSSSSPVKEGEERYVQVASRFFRMKPATGGGGCGAMTLPHYLDACFLCKRSIPRDRDIFMYRGDAAFCSDECRQEQIYMDEALHAVARRHRALLYRRPAMVEQVAGTARREVEASRPPPMMHRRPTIANIGAARTPVAAS